MGIDRPGVPALRAGVPAVRLGLLVGVTLLAALLPALGLPAAGRVDEAAAAGAGAPSAEAYFQFDYPPYPDTFVFKLTDPEKIQAARDMLGGLRPKRPVMGTIVKQPAAYNPPWSYHLDPPSIDFFNAAIEVCDASIGEVQAHLADVCGTMLPDCIWCPWRARLLAEVAPAVPAAYLPIVLHEASSATR